MLPKMRCITERDTVMAKTRSGSGTGTCGSTETGAGIGPGMTSSDSTGGGSSTGIKAKTKQKRPGAFFNDATRRSLLEAIKDPGNRKSWNEFFDIYGPFIKGIGKRQGLDAHRVEDLVIIVVTEVNEKLAAYDPEIGGFRKWFKTMVRRRAIDLWRNDERFPEPIIEPHDQDGRPRNGAAKSRIRKIDDDFEAMWEKEEAGAILRIAQRITKAKVSPRKWQIFECRVLRDWPVARVCETLGVTTNAVYNAICLVKPVFAEAREEASTRLDRGPLSPLDRKALEDTLPLPSYAKTKRTANAVGNSRCLKEKT